MDLNRGEDRLLCHVALRLHGCSAALTLLPIATSTISPVRTSFTRGRPCGSPRPVSCASIARQPSQVTRSGHCCGEELLARLAGSGVLGRVQLARVAVLDDPGDGVGRVLLVGADHARRAALDPADDVLADLVLAVVGRGRGRRGWRSGPCARRTGCRPAARRGSRSTRITSRRITSSSPPLAVLVDHAAALVADQPAALVERDAGQRRAAVADRAQHEAAGDDLLLAGGDGAQAPFVDLDSLTIADAGDRAVLALAEDLDRRAQEAQLDAALVAVRLALRVLAQELDVALVRSGRPRRRATSR